MALPLSPILDAARDAFDAQERELAATRGRAPLAVVSRTATGSGDIDETFALDRAFRLVFVRCHYTGTDGTGLLHLSVDSAHGPASDARLFTISLAGTGHDVHLRIGGDDNREPSAWTFQPGDAVRIQWTNPDSGNITWGLEVGLALAS